ncbi:MAG: hydroxyphenylacetyl-CoA thioesterase PaaI [Bacteroidia bacterium]|nr:hydroxyphenylacetyl-CoA thioesterase PaaI [Bacteroidia bacterium]
MPHSPEENIAHMTEHDHFSRWMGIEILEVGKGSCSIRMKVKKDMLNGFGILHGGVSFAMADSALAFASNSHGRLSVALSNSITYPNPSKEGDELTAVAKEISLGFKTASYDINITNQEGKEVALFRGTVYRTSKPVIPDNTPQ